jgi:hypothetical protein
MPSIRVRRIRRADQRTKQGRVQAAITAARRPTTAVMINQIRRIKDMPLTRLPEFMESVRDRDNVRLQEDVVQACLRRILSHESPEL